MPRASRLRLAALALALWACAAATAPLAQAQDPGGSGPPRVDARSWTLVDASDGEVLAARAPHRSAPVASATKLMTAYVARRALRLGQRVTAPAYAASPVESLLGLREGERIRVRDLLAGLLLASGNDAAVALAEAASGSVPDFVAEMNAAARRLGLRDTGFANPIGLDHPDNRSSPADLAALAIELRRDPFFRDLFDAPSVRLESGEMPREVENRNRLLGSTPWVNGVKTGHTLGAGHVLVGSGTRKGVTLVSVVLGAPSEERRDAATLRLLRYGFSLYRRLAAVERGERLASAAVRHRDRRLRLLAGRTVRITVRDGQRVAVRPVAPAEVEGPIDRRQRLGRAIVRVDGEVEARLPLLAARSIPAPTLIDRVDAALPGPRIALWTLALAGMAAGVGAAVMLADRSRRRKATGIVSRERRGR